MHRLRLSISDTLVLLLATSGFFQVVHGKGAERSVQIQNESGHRINVYWINRWNHDELVINNEEPVLFGADMAINSFVTHEFEIQEVPHSKTNVCGGPDGICRTASFQVNENEGQVIIVKKGVELEHKDNKSIARDQAKDLLQECKAKVSNEKSMDDLFECVNTGLSESLEKSREEIQFQRGVRSKLGSHLVTYACADDNLNTTSSIENVTFVEPTTKKRHAVKVLHSHDTAKIHYVEKFVSDKECQAVLEKTELKAVAENDGLVGKRGVVPMDAKSYFLALQRRVLDYTQEMLEISDLREDPQENLVLIQYSGEGLPDQYQPHCDGPFCTNGDGQVQHKGGERIATMIMHCETADKGGSTIFHNSGIHVKPKKGDAVFVSYMDPETYKMDSGGFAAYSGCPVRQGEKYEVVQYVRMGEAGAEETA